MSIYRRVLAYYRPFSAQTALGLVLSLGAIGLSLLRPWPFKIIVDDILHEEPATPALAIRRTLIPLLCLAARRNPDSAGGCSISPAITFS